MTREYTKEDWIQDLRTTDLKQKRNGWCNIDENNQITSACCLTVAWCGNRGSRTRSYLQPPPEKSIASWACVWAGQFQIDDENSDTSDVFIGWNDRDKLTFKQIADRLEADHIWPVDEDKARGVAK